MSACVFIVDDDEAVRDSLRLLLESHDRRVVVCAGGEELFAVLSTASVGCLVFDYHLAVTTGLDLLGEVRARQIALPAVLITGLIDPDIHARAKAAGVAGVLEKPFAERALLDAIDAALIG